MQLAGYLKVSNKTVTQLSRQIGVSRQSIYKWIEDRAEVETTDIGIRITTKSERVLYEGQVAK